jgi:methylmalonyl-CoA mutase N-terminal domain/subunit
MAACLGGTQSLHTNSRDEALALPTEKSVQLALRTQQLLAYETGIPKVADPLGGSYYLESLTNKLEEESNNYIKQIDKLGGALAAIEQGYFQKEISNSAYQYQKEIENQQRIIVGVNRFTDKEPSQSTKTLKVTPALQKKQITRLTQYKKKRNNQLLTKALGELKATARTKENLIPPIIEAIKSKATLGEISQSLKEVFGEHKGASIF